jgi:hypothetical protein
MVERDGETSTLITVGGAGGDCGASLLQPATAIITMIDAVSRVERNRARLSMYFAAALMCPSST